MRDERQAGTMQGKMSIRKKISELQTGKDKEWKNYEKAKETIRKNTEELIKDVENKMQQRVKDEIIFKIKWKLA